MKLIRKMAFGLTLAASITSVTAVSAGATAPVGTGWDDVVDTIIGQGSDTTYRMESDLASTYNQTNGCDVQTADVVVSSVIVAPFSGDCKAPANISTVTGGNWDHDQVVNKFPVGSSQGVKELLRGGVDFARSSRGPRTSGETGTTFWGIAKDGIAITTLGGRAPFSITQAQALGIWNCTITNWNQLDPSFPSATIYPYGMNPSSGTKASFDSFLGIDANAGTCVKKLSTGAFPFENDVKQLNDTPAAGTNLADSIWWGSFAELKTYSFKRQSADFMSINGVAISNGTIANNSYPIKRFVYHVTANSAVAPDNAGGTTGADTGKPGAVREFTQWLCKPKAAHTTSDYTGASIYDINTTTITNSGFQRIPTAERTNGGVCAIAVAP